MRNIKLTIEYDGKCYSGFQSQNNALGIQEVIERAISSVTFERVKLISSGRTDKGVHALAQVANFHTSSTIPVENFVKAINRKLPDDIKIKEAEEVDPNFHSRFSAKKKRYRYVIYNGKLERPLYRNYSYHIIKKIDVEKIRDCLPYFLGTHDFKTFMGPKTKFKDTIRTIYSIDIEENGEFIEFIIVGNNFLRHMVRIMVGTFIFVGIGKIKVEEVPEIIQGKKRKLAGITARPEGLFLEKVYYD